jgi:hypothetical protein
MSLVVQKIKFKLYCSLIGGVISTTLGLFFFIEHYNITTAHFLINIGLINYVIFAALFVMYAIKKKRITKIEL